MRPSRGRVAHCRASDVIALRVLLFAYLAAKALALLPFLAAVVVIVLAGVLIL